MHWNEEMGRSALKGIDLLWKLEKDICRNIKKLLDLPVIM